MFREGGGGGESEFGRRMERIACGNRWFNSRGVPAGDVSWMRLEVDNRKAKRRENWERRVAANRP